MSYVRKSITGVWATSIGVVLLGAIAVWQFYLFVTSEGATGILSGRGHLWLAIVSAVFACIAAFFVFSVFLRYDRDDEMHITSTSGH
jgi:hypothetical protein